MLLALLIEDTAPLWLSYRRCLVVGCLLGCYSCAMVPIIFVIITFKAREGRLRMLDLAGSVSNKRCRRCCCGAQQCRCLLSSVAGRCCPATSASHLLWPLFLLAGIYV